MNILPKDILLIIFGYLNRKSLNAISLVCKKINNLVFEPSIRSNDMWRNVIYRNYSTIIKNGNFNNTLGWYDNIFGDFNQDIGVYNSFKSSIRTIDCFTGILVATKAGDLDMLIYLLNRAERDTYNDIIDSFVIAAENYKYEICRWYIKDYFPTRLRYFYPASMDHIMAAAVYGGDLYIIGLVLEFESTIDHKIGDWYRIIGCFNDNIDVLDYILDVFRKRGHEVDWNIIMGDYIYDGEMIIMGEYIYDEEMTINTIDYIIMQSGPNYCYNQVKRELLTLIPVIN